MSVYTFRVHGPTHFAEQLGVLLLPKAAGEPYFNYTLAWDILHVNRQAARKHLHDVTN